MKILIYAAKKSASQLVNTIGKYLYNHINNAYQSNKFQNTYDINFTLDTSDGNKYLNLNITTYGDKIRVNIIENEDANKTIGNIVVKSSTFDKLPDGYFDLMGRISKQIDKEYSSHADIFY